MRLAAFAAVRDHAVHLRATRVAAAVVGRASLAVTKEGPYISDTFHPMQEEESLKEDCWPQARPACGGKFRQVHLVGHDLM
jgi:hypothetical protein